MYSVPVLDASTRLRPDAPVASRCLRICKVWDGEYPWDVRAEKVALALTRTGHDVHMVARNRQGLARVEHLPEATVHRLAPWRWVPPAVNAASMFPAFFNPRWSTAIARVARSIRADLILCRDLPLAVPSIRVARRIGIPIILDMAENYPAMLASRHATGATRPWDLLVRNPTAARWVEHWVLPRLDGVLVMVPESADRLELAGVPANKIAVVSNTPPRSRLDGPGATHHGADRLEVVYLGLMEAQRGIGTLIDAAALLSRTGLNLRLTLIGAGIDEGTFRAQIDSLGLPSGLVAFRGWMDNSIALRELAKAHVGVVPHWKDESWDTSIPNKLYDYMAAGLAVVTSDAAPAARIVQSTDAGRVFRSRDTEDLMRALCELRDPEVRIAHAANGRRAIAETYNWEADSERMLRFIRRISDVA